jgi:hypothetical protein
MSDSQALVPQEQRTVDFYGDQITAVLVDKEPYIPIRPICEYLGLSWAGQLERTLRDPVLSEMTATIRIKRVEGNREVSRDLVCLRLKYLNGWLFGINATRVREELQEKVIQYQRECYEILAEAFQPRPLASPTGLVAIRELGLAIAQMADQQIIHEERITFTEKRLDRAAEVVGDIGKRLRAVEGRIRPDRYITDEQGAEISIQVKSLAALLGGHYQTVFMELYRRFGVASYKLLRIEQYELVLDFLEEWRQTVVAEQQKEK